MNKVQLIKAELARLKEETSIGLSEHENGVEQGRMEIINALSIFLDSMQEEHVNKGSHLGCGVIWKDEELEEAAKHYLYSNILYDDVYVGNPTEKDCIEMFRAGAKWQKKQLLKDAIKATAHPEDCELWCNLSQTNLQDLQEIKVIIIKED